MNIQIGISDEEILACLPVIRELRPHVSKEEFLNRLRNQEKDGYQLAYIQESGEVIAVAGFRIGKNLAWGRFLYIDDLVTLPEHRSQGHGKALLDWLRDYASKEGCEQLHLDSGSQRKDAHRFYEREGMKLEGYHFVEILAPCNN